MDSAAHPRSGKSFSTALTDRSLAVTPSAQTRRLAMPVAVMTFSASSRLAKIGKSMFSSTCAGTHAANPTIFTCLVVKALMAAPSVASAASFLMPFWESRQSIPMPPESCGARVCLQSPP